MNPMQWKTHLWHLTCTQEQQDQETTLPHCWRQDNTFFTVHRCLQLGPEFPLTAYARTADTEAIPHQPLTKNEKQPGGRCS